MTMIYDLKEDKKKIKDIQDKIKRGLSGYRTKLGLFGSVDWFDNIRKENLIKIIEGEISKVYLGGHNDFPMFEVASENDRYEFAIIGDEKQYVIGRRIVLKCLLNENICPSSGLEKVFVPIKIVIVY